MEGIAPACRWRSFQHWALVAMPCQQASTTEQKRSFSHTPLVNVMFSCHGSGYARACNVINWMLSIPQYKGLLPIPALGFPDELTGFLIGPTVHTALHKFESMGVCRNRLWTTVEVSGRKQMDLLGIIMSLRSRTSIRHIDGHELCTQSKCQGAHIDSTRFRQLYKNFEGDG
ncbi:hypothetical protein DL768_009768 [Monosporascus sp. mg162]|nr:hypothetical protein DL768_009768 [Monosporascus sp. mg162]